MLISHLSKYHQACAFHYDVRMYFSIGNETHNSGFSSLYLFKIKLKRIDLTVKTNLNFHNGSNASSFSSQKRALEGQKRYLPICNPPFCSTDSKQPYKILFVYFRNHFSYSSQDLVDISQFAVAHQLS